MKNVLHLKRHNLRQEILALRNDLSAEERGRKSLVITERLSRLAAFAGARTPFIYVDFRSEVETLPLIRLCLDRGMRVVVPRTDRAAGRLTAHIISDPEHDLAPGYCGIPEPVPERTVTVAPEEIDVVVLPGSVFDAAGGRLGYGGGYYDRFLVQQAPQALRIGIGFELQVVAVVPLLPHDQLLHWLVTEERVVEISSCSTVRQHLNHQNQYNESNQSNQ